MSLTRRGITISDVTGDVRAESVQGAITIGGAAVTSVSVVNAATVTAVTPAGTAGAKTVPAKKPENVPPVT